MCYSHEESVATTLSGSTPLAFGEAGLRRILAGGVLLDAPALLTIQNLGLGELAGVQVRGSIERDAAELILPGKINGCSVETRRDCRQSFWGGSAYVLEPTAQGVCVLGELEDYGDEGLGITMTAFENELGGRVVVSGYRPWFLVHSRSKSNQLKHVLSWLSRGGMPAMVEDFAKVVVWARGRDGVPSSLVLLNASLDPLPRLRIGVRTSSTSAILHTMGGPETEIEISSTSSRPAFEVENVEPWSVHLVDLRGDAGPST
jgi:hypothetical protein